MGIRRFVSSRDLGRISKRKLYTDEKDVICHFCRTFILNGINVPGTSPDLLDRAILIELERLPEEERRDKRGLEARFNEIRPRLFGAIVEAISEAILLRDSIYLDWLPRVADWCLWGCAVAEALGIGQERFLTAHYRSIRKQNQELLEAERYMIHRLEEFRNAETYGIRPKRVFREAATRYLEEATKQSLGRDAQVLKLLALFIGDLPLESVHTGTLQEYVKDRTKAGWKKRTINYGLATVRRILNLAANEWIDEHGLSWQPGLRVHDLKHTFGRRLRAAGVSFEDRQDLLGHKSTRITTHYSQPELAKLVAAANTVCEENARKMPTLVVVKKKIRLEAAS